MEPRSWKWIQMTVIVVAMAIGLGVALWYQNRPVDDALPPAVAMPSQKMVLHPMHPDVIPNVAPLKPLSGDTVSASATGDAAGGTETPPSQSSAYAAQNTVVDPMAHLRLPPVTSSVPSSGVPSSAAPYGVAPTAPTSAVPLPSSPNDSAAPDGVPSAAPFTTLPGSAPAPSSPAPSSPSVSPFVTTAPPADGSPSTTGP